jgi:hypothetical protein
MQIQSNPAKAVASAITGSVPSTQAPIVHPFSFQIFFNGFEKST